MRSWGVAILVGLAACQQQSKPPTIGFDGAQASGAAAVLMGARLGRSLAIRQGVGSEISVRPGPEGTIEVGGRCTLSQVRDDLA